MINADKFMIGFCSIWAITATIVWCLFGKDAAWITSYGVFVIIAALIVVAKQTIPKFGEWLMKR